MAVVTVKALGPEQLLTTEAFLAVLIDELKHKAPQWHWLCLNDTARKEMIDDALVEFEKWKRQELEWELQRRDRHGT